MTVGLDGIGGKLTWNAQGPGFEPQYHIKPHTVAQAWQAPGRWKQENQKLKGILSFIVSLSPDWAT